jgi:peroxiredoxin
MRITLLMLAVAFFGVVHGLSDRSSTSTAPTRPGFALQGRPIDPPATEVCLGDIAPDVSYQGVDARWRRLHELVAESPVLLVFGANDAALRAIEREREALMDLGIRPVAVVGSRLGVTRALTTRLELRYTVLADPQGVIAAQFNAFDPASDQAVPTWFVLDPKRRVRGLGRAGLPKHGYQELSATALGLPSKSATVPAEK